MKKRMIRLVSVGLAAGICMSVMSTGTVLADEAEKMAVAECYAVSPSWGYVEPQYYQVEGTGRLGLQVRTRPSVESRSFGAVAEGTAVMVVAVQGDWAFASLNGEFGWMNLTYLKRHASVTQYQVSVYETGKEGLELRTNPSTKGAVIINIPEDTPLVIEKNTGNGWGYTNYQGHEGYVNLTDTRVLGYYEAETPKNGFRTGSYIVSGAGKDGLELRVRPSDESSSYGKLYDGTVLEAEAEKGDWVYVRYLGGHGWCSTEKLKAVTACEGYEGVLRKDLSQAYEAEENDVYADNSGLLSDVNFRIAAEQVRKIADYTGQDGERLLTEIVVYPGQTEYCDYFGERADWNQGSIRGTEIKWLAETIYNVQPQEIEKFIQKCESGEHYSLEYRDGGFFFEPDYREKGRGVVCGIKSAEWDGDTLHAVLYGAEELKGISLEKINGYGWGTAEADIDNAVYWDVRMMKKIVNGYERWTYCSVRKLK